MENTLELPSDYYEQYFNSEKHFREKYEAAYFSKPVIHNVNGNCIAIAPWGNPGWSTAIIFPYAHKIIITYQSYSDMFFPVLRSYNDQLF